MRILARTARIVGGTLVVLMELALGWFTSGGMGCFSFLDKSRAARRREVIVVALVGVGLTVLVHEEGDPSAAPIVGCLALFIVAYLLAVHVYLSIEERDGERPSAKGRRRAQRWTS